MRIVVFSDSHGDCSNLENSLRQQPNAEIFIHLGDGQWDVDQVRLDFPRKAFLSVRGNCDFSSDLPSERTLTVSGKRIFFTHGHLYFVKSGPSRIIAEAVKRKADILLYGHTHTAYTSYENGLYIMNPGSLGHPSNGRPSYGTVDITPAGVVTHIVEV